MIYLTMKLFSTPAVPGSALRKTYEQSQDGRCADIVITAGARRTGAHPKDDRNGSCHDGCPLPFLQWRSRGPCYMSACHQTVQETGSSQPDI